MIEMPIRSENSNTELSGADFVEVMFARSVDEADRVRRMLAGEGIPALTERSVSLPSQCGVAVLVAPDRLVEATQVLTTLAVDEDEEIEIDDDDDDDDDVFADDDEAADDDLDDDDEDLAEDDDEF